MSLPSEEDSESCLAITNGKVFILKHKLVKNPEGREVPVIWTKEEIRCRYCNKLLLNENSWLKFKVKFHDEEKIPRLSDGNISDWAIIWSCRRIHLPETVFMTYFGDTISRILNLETLCAIKLFKINYVPKENEISNDIKEKYIRACSGTKELKVELIEPEISP